MELREWTAAAIDPGEGPPTADEWVDIEGPRSPSAFAGESVVAYRTRFSAPEGGERALLGLRGLYAHARVWLNGGFLGSHDTYFTPFRAAFDPEAENELLVECRAPEDRFGGVFETPLVAPEKSVPGIRWGARVDPVPETVITDLTVRPDGDEPGVNAIVTVDAGTDLDGRIRLSLRPEGADGASALNTIGVSADAGERVTVRGRLSVRDPERWWPRGFGPQNRYTVNAALGGSERSATTGFRTVEYGSEGLFVNGTRVPVRGRVSLPDDPHDAAATVERAVETNATLVRWYGHAPPKALYDAADRDGILVQQDVPLSPGALDAERARLVARRLAGEYGHHPSLAVFGVHDDAYGFDVTTDEGDRRVARATAEGGRAATATAAAAALPDDVPAIPTPGVDAGGVAGASGWVIDGYSGTDRPFDPGPHTRYVVPRADAAAAERARLTIEALRRTGKPLLTVFVPSGAAADPTDAAFAPVGLFLDDPSAAEPRVVVVNDTPEPVVGDLEWSAEGTHGTLPVDVDPLSRQVLGAISAVADPSRVDLSLSPDG